MEKINNSPIIQVSELRNLLQSKDLILIDASNGKDAKENYLQCHIEGALFVDLDSQLAEIGSDFSLGGRHPLPSVANFCEVLQSLGISAKSHVVVYDNASGANAAARFWWMLKSAGHQNIQVLNGGFQEALKNNLPTERGESRTSSRGNFSFDSWQLPLVTIEEVEIASNNKSTIIDVRAKERFNGESEPIDLIAGHIPNAINIPLTENLDSNGLFHCPTELKKMYQNKIGKLDSENWIVHCGSGVTACHTILACDYAGLKTPKLYVGSWSEWSRQK